MAIADREKTVFTTPFGLFQFTQMSFGLKGAPATFQRMVDQLLDGSNDLASVYMDDVIVYSPIWKDHLCHLRQVLQCIQSAGLTLRTKGIGCHGSGCVLGTHSWEWTSVLGGSKCPYHQDLPTAMYEEAGSLIPGSNWLLQEVCGMCH